MFLKYFKDSKELAVIGDKVPHISIFKYNDTDATLKQLPNIENVIDDFFDGVASSENALWFIGRLLLLLNIFFFETFNFFPK